jgi:GNAT superfamily N-acetyltransferase
MRELPLGWRTDLEALRFSGAHLTRHDDYIAVRSPDNPGYYWGNFLMVTRWALAGDAAACVAAFRAEFPDAGHIAIGLPGRQDAAGWERQGLTYEVDEVLCARMPPALTGAPEGYESRQLHSVEDWERCARADIVEHVRVGGQVTAAHTEYTHARMRSRGVVTDAGAGAFFGAFAGGELVADLGIVVCSEGVARYQSVSTAHSHRRRGLAAHLLGLAGRWALRQGATRWVIVAEPGSEANLLYRRLGMQPCDVSCQAFRAGAG